MKLYQKLTLLCDIYMQIERFINACTLIYYNKYFGPQILPFAELFVFSSNTREMTHIAPGELLEQCLYSCAQKGCKLCLGLCFFTMSLQF